MRSRQAKVYDSRKRGDLDLTPTARVLVEGAGSQRTPKLADRIAGQIEQDILRAGWQVGSRLGGEGELARKYGVSRWVMREAIGIVEGDGLIEIRRGRGGGLLVAAPAAAAVQSVIGNYLEFSDVTFEEVLAARLALENLAIELASVHLTPSRVADLRELCQRRSSPTESDSVKHAYGLLLAIIAVNDNPVLETFIAALATLTVSSAIRDGAKEGAIRRTALTISTLRRHQIEALIAMDLPRAYELQRQLMECSRALAPTGSRRSAARSLNPQRAVVRNLFAPEKSRPNGVRKGTVVQERIRAEILAANWSLGKNLGSEAELLKRYKVSRNVLREAIRPLERLGAVTMRGGTRSGLFVARPDPSAAIRSVVLHWRSMGISWGHIDEVAPALELANTSLVVQLPPARREAVLERLRQIVVARRRPDLFGLHELVREFYLALAEAGQNRVISLFLLILSACGRLTGVPKAQRPADLLDATRATFLRFIHTLEAGDLPLARRGMAEVRACGYALIPDQAPLEWIVQRDGQGGDG